MSPKRIYIGGLTPDVTQSDVSGRFKPFGDVLSCDVIPAKAPDADPSNCRGFAYVTLQPKDDASLARVLSLYNGCKWRGQKLRVELAKPDYLSRLQLEWDQQQRQEQQQQEQQQLEQQQPSKSKQQQQQQEEGAAASDAQKNVLRLPVPGSKRKYMTVDLSAKPASHRAWFPVHKSKPPQELSWEPLPPSKRAALQAAADAATPVLDAARHAQQLQATQELLRQLEARQQQWQQVTVVRQDEGAAVPHTYQQQQQQEQQQAQQKKPAAKKGASKQVEQELVSQLKLLKRLAEKEQHQQGGRGSNTATVEFADAEPAELQQQQHLPPQRQQQPQQQQQPTRRGMAAAAHQQPTQGGSNKQQIVRLKDAAGRVLEPGAGSSSGSEASLLDGGSSSDYESDGWEQWLQQEGLAAADAADGPGSTDAAGGSQQAQQPGQQQQKQRTAQLNRHQPQHSMPEANAVMQRSNTAALLSQKKASGLQQQPQRKVQATPPTTATATGTEEALDLERFGSSDSEGLLDADGSSSSGDEARRAAAVPAGNRRKQRGLQQQQQQRKRPAAKQQRASLQGDMLLCPRVKPSGL